MNYASPLRYPGGKAKLYNFVKEIIKVNELIGETYIEPFVGGAGLALTLLLNNDVKRIVINDLDSSIYAFWYSVLHFTEDLCSKIEETPVTIQQWENQKRIMNSKDSNILEYGFSTFFLNRTNVSGVIKGGVIGGIEQNGLYKIDARFNKEALVRRIKQISERKSSIFLYNLDATEFIKPKILGKYHNAFIYFDPPYVNKGYQLYKNSFSKEDHKSLEEAIKKCNRKWIVTYDICDTTENLYVDFPKIEIPINYSAGNKKKSKEYMFFSKKTVIPQIFYSVRTAELN